MSGFHTSAAPHKPKHHVLKDPKGTKYVKQKNKDGERLKTDKT